jgi:hypothetical protein
MLSQPPNTVTPAAQQLHRWKRPRTRRIGHDGDAARCQQLGCSLHDIRSDIAERISVADGDVALHAQRLRARANLFYLENAEHRGIVQMDIDINAAALGDAEHHIEMFLDIAVEATGIETADHVRAEIESSIEQIRRARTAQDAALREGDKLDVDEVAMRLAHGEDGLQRCQADRTVDHHMAAHARAAVTEAKLKLAPRALSHRRGLGHVVGLDGDALLHVEAVRIRHMRPPDVAVETGVEMDVTFDEGRDHKRAAEIDGLCGCRCWIAAGYDRGDQTATDGNRVEAAVGEFRPRKNFVDVAHANLSD